MLNNSAPSVFRYVHISDLHFCTQPWRTYGNLFKRNLHPSIDTFDKKAAPQNEWNSIVRPASYIPEIASGVAEFCHRLNRKFDGIIVSGDLSTTGRGGDLAVARSFVTDPPSYGPFIRYNEPTISATTAASNIHLIPGNHDRYQDDFGTPGSPHFSLMFEKPYMRNLQGDTGHWVKSKAGREIGFVYADFSLRRRSHASNPASGPYGEGRVYGRTLSQLTKKTVELQERGIPVIWIIHFAPYDCSQQGLELINFRKVTDTAKRLNVIATLCGHTHVQDQIVVNGHPVFCAGSACCVDSKNKSRVHLISIEVSEQHCKVSRRNFAWSWDRDSFIEIQPD
jgi:hypothetical protein